MLIRALTQLDAKQFWDLRLRALQESSEAFGTSYEEEAVIPLDKHISHFNNDFIAPAEDNFILGAFNENDDIIGTVGFRREKRIKLRHKASIWGMYIIPELRQTGIGKLLLSEALSKSMSIEGLEQIILGVVSSNVKAKGLYTSLGFKTYGQEKRALKIGDRYFDEDLMVLFMK